MTTKLPFDNTIYDNSKITEIRKNNVNYGTNNYSTYTFTSVDDSEKNNIISTKPYIVQFNDLLTYNSFLKIMGHPSILPHKQYENLYKNLRIAYGGFTNITTIKVDAIVNAANSGMQGEVV